MADLPISSLPAATTGYSDSLMVIVNYNPVSSGRTESIPFSAITATTIGTSGTSGTSGVDGSAGTSGTSGTSPSSPYPYVYGLFTQTGDSAVVSGITEQSIIGTGLGGFTVGANQFQVGDTFHATIKGHLSNANDFLEIRVKSDSVTLSDSSSIQYNTGGEECFMELDLYFIILQTGTTGNASIFTKGLLKTIKPSNFTVNGYAFEDINNTTFDTTISNTLDITFQFDVSDSSTYVYTDFFVLNKLY
jgi:hypothetical protein